MIWRPLRIGTRANKQCVGVVSKIKHSPGHYEHPRGPPCPANADSAPPNTAVCDDLESVRTGRRPILPRPTNLRLSLRGRVLRVSGGDARLFVRAYSQYLQLATNGDILESGNLEAMARAFQVGPLATLSVIGTLIYIVSAIHLVVTRSRQRPSL